MKTLITVLLTALLLARCSGEVTASQAENMHKADSTALLFCQTAKYKADVGKAKARGFVTKELFQGQPTPNHLQVAFIEKEGVSCTRKEMDSYRGAQ
jgi:hypothetical protein